MAALPRRTPHLRSTGPTLILYAVRFSRAASFAGQQRFRPARRLGSATGSHYINP
jgi:hypothetical protein